MDIAIQYQQNLEKFVAALNQHGKWNFDNGRKFTRVFETLSNGQNVGRYFVDKNSQVIYGAKSWNQDRKSTRLNSSHVSESRMPSSA